MEMGQLMTRAAIALSTSLHNQLSRAELYQHAEFFAKQQGITFTSYDGIEGGRCIDPVIADLIREARRFAAMQTRDPDRYARLLEEVRVR